MSNEFRAAAQRVEANPLGRLMYGQRELFHSNLLAWFFDVLPAAADEVFRDFAQPGIDSERRVDRERGHLDLVMRWTDRAPLVIENKVFSLPQLDQLEEYAAATAKWATPPAFVLLSMSAAPSPLGDWHHLKYSVLAERILASLPNESTYEIETMRRYAALVGDLELLVGSVGVESEQEQVWLPDDLLAAISSSQMRAALQKARAQRVASHLADALKLEAQPWSAISNATPLVEIFSSTLIVGEPARVGWQLQGSSFRRSIIFEDPELLGRDEGSRQRREEVSRQHPHLFSLPSSLGSFRAGRKEFNHFAPDSVYQYGKVPAITIGVLIAAAREVAEDVRSESNSQIGSRS